MTVQFFKKPDILHWGFESFLLGEDEHGVWLSTPRGTRRWKGEDDRSPVRNNAVFCLPRDEWWVLYYNGPLTEYSHFVDISTVPRFVSDGRVEMIDLDLDVVVRQDGSVFIDDEDEFAVHQMLYGYTGEEIRMARETTDRVAQTLRSGDEPFFVAARSWWEQVEAL